MPALADHILRGQTQEARALAEQDRASVSVTSTGPEHLFPADLALRCGHEDLVALLLRLGAPMKLTPPSKESLLLGYLSHLSSSYFCASMMDGIATSVWEQIFEGRKVFYDEQDPAFGMSISEKRDVHWLIQKCGINTKDAFIALENKKA